MLPPPPADLILITLQGPGRGLAALANLQPQKWLDGTKRETRPGFAGPFCFPKLLNFHLISRILAAFCLVRFCS